MKLLKNALIITASIIVFGPPLLLISVMISHDNRIRKSLKEDLKEQAERTELVEEANEQ